MSQLQVHKAKSSGDTSLPIFDEFDKLADRLRLRAYNLFARRGSGEGHALDDWLTAEKEVAWPAAELTETDGSYAISVALAGFDAGDIEVAATPEEVMIKAKHRHDETGQKDEPRVRWSEFRSNEVMRRFAMPSPIVVDKVAADFQNGMLKVTAPIAPKAEESAKRIEVKSK